jgi:hypothetical protein
MIRALLLAAVLAVLVTAAVVLVTGGRPRVRRISTKASRGLAGLAILAISLAVVLAFTAGDLWPSTPLVLWVAAFLAVRERATRRVEQERRRRRQRLESFGEHGVELMDRADAAVGRITTSEAATEGWLGDLDFSPDIAMIADTLEKITALRATASELAAITTSTPDDMRQLRESRSAVARFEQSVAARVQALENCAAQTKRIDQMLQRQRDEVRITQQRDEVRGRLDALLRDDDAAPPSEATDAVTARISAFHELTDVLDAQRRRGPAGEV